MTQLTQAESAQLIDAIAAKLPGTASGHRPEDDAYSRHAGYVLIDGATDPRQGPAIYIQNSREPGKAHISPVWPWSPERQVITPRHFLPWSERDNYTQAINVSLTKSPERIAGDIRRRLLSEYRDLYAQARAYIEREQAREQSAEATRTQLAALIKSASPPNSYHKAPEQRRQIHRYSNTYPGVNGRLNHDGTEVYSLELTHLSIAEARRILLTVARIDADRDRPMMTPEQIERDGVTDEELASAAAFLDAYAEHAATAARAGGIVHFHDCDNCGQPISSIEPDQALCRACRPTQTP